jgi:hypothetical protein
MAWEAIQEIEHVWRLAHPQEGDGASQMPSLNIEKDAKVLPLVAFGRLNDPNAPLVGARVTITITLGSERRVLRNKVKKLAKAVL